VDLELSEDQRRLHDNATEFARAELGDRRVDENDDNFISAWQACARFGVHGLPIPADYGGAAADAVTVAAALEGLGYGSRNNGILFSINAQLWSCEMPLLRFGSASQKDRYLPRLCDGSAIGAQAMTEPTSGSDASSLRTTAERAGSDFVLNGAKTFITNAPVADLLIVFASTDRDQGFAGISAFIIDTDQPGVTIGPPAKKMGLEDSPMGDVFLDDCRVSAENVLGPLGAGMAIFNSAMEWERGMIMASSLGTMKRQLEECVAYAKERKQFTKPIAEFQAVSHKIADMRVRIETGRLLLYRFAQLKAAGRSAAVEASIAKLVISEGLLQSSLDALQIHGGYGYMADLGFEQVVRDAVAGRIYSGTSEMQRNLIARYSGL
jgi:alkylation response protein AidB-like acyl-CoA dehydrogenase